MKLFLDSADVEEIGAASALGILDGVTMNPKLLAGAAPSRELVSQVCARVRGPLCLPARGDGVEDLVREARRLAALQEQVVVKVPLGAAGVQALRRLQAEGIRTHATLCASAAQALLAAKCGATFVSPFLGRLEEQGESGADLVARILEIYARYGFETQVMVASVRHTQHVEEAARRGAHACTMPWSVLGGLAEHALTDALRRDYAAAHGG